ncbi:immunoglobulin super DCC subclass member, partial [Perkinsus olseni]
MNNPLETGEGGGLQKIRSTTSTASDRGGDDNDFSVEDNSSPKAVLREAFTDESTPKPDSYEKRGKCAAFNYWCCMIFCCRPPHEMSDEERIEWEKKSFWDKYKGAFFCFIRYFIMFLIGIGIGI